MKQNKENFSDRKANRLAIMPVIAGGFCLLGGVLLIWLYPIHYQSFLAGILLALGVNSIDRYLARKGT
jgi:hypothetical protein